MKDFKKNKFNTKDVSSAAAEGLLEKIKPGLYRLSELEYPDNVSLSFVDISKAVSNGVICLISALSYYELTTFNPSEIYIAVPNNAYVPKIKYPPIRPFYFRDTFYKSGIDIIETKYGRVKIYNKEKTICDMFRYRNKLGEDLAMEGLKTYLSQKGPDLFKLRKYAEISEVKTIMTPVLKALIDQNG